MNTKLKFFRIVLFIGCAFAANSYAKVLDFSIGSTHTCAMTTKGARCWGSNKFGQSTIPAELKNITQIEASVKSTCALNNGVITCWGVDGSDINKSLAAYSNIKVKKFWFEAPALCFVTREMAFHCAGIENGVYQQFPKEPEKLRNVTNVYVNNTTICTFSESGLECTKKEWEPKDASLHSVKSIFNFEFDPCVLSEGSIKCAKYPNDYFSSLKNVEFAVGFDYRMCVKQKGQVPACFDGEKSEYSERYAIPVFDRDFANLIQMKGTRERACALNTRGALLCWGLDVFGANTVPSNL